MRQPERTALVLVDVLNGFFHPDGAMHYPTAPDVLPAISQLLDRARESGALRVHIADRHRPGVPDSEFDVIPEHLLRGEFDAEFFTGFAPLPGEPVVEKRRYSAFFATDLALLLREHAITTVIVAGVKTNVCVRATATDAFAHGFRVVVPRAATNSNRQHLEAASIEDMERYIAEVVDLPTAMELL
jgi:nicotinamidase-related amidase